MPKKSTTAVSRKRPDVDDALESIAKNAFSSAFNSSFVVAVACGKPAGVVTLTQKFLNAMRYQVESHQERWDAQQAAFQAATRRRRAQAPSARRSSALSAGSSVSAAADAASLSSDLSAYETATA
ncbi:MAG: hypothetical protein ACRDFS_07235 [Chloroflexota bacterium]